MTRAIKDTDVSFTRRKYLLALGLSTATGISGCLGGTGSGSGAVNITYRDRDQPLAGYAKAFNKTHDKVNVKPSMKPPDAKYRTLIAQIKAGNAPEVVGLDVVYLPRFVQLGALADLGDLYKNLNYTDDFFKPLRQDFIRWNNTIYGLPFWIDCSVYLYNKKHYRKAGLDPKQPPQTFSEFLDACKALKQAGYKPLSNTLAFTGLEVFYYMPHVWAGGGRLFNEKMTKCLIDQPPGVDALKFFITLQEKGYATDQTSKAHYTYPPFIAEKTSMAYSGAGIGTIKKKNPELYENMGVSMFPKPEGGHQSSFLGGNSITIPAQITKTQKKFEAAKTFLKWVNTKEGIQTTVKEMGYLPARKTGFELDFVQERMDLYGPFKKALEQGHAPPMHPDLLKMQAPLNNAIVRALLGEQKPQAALSQAAQQITEILQKTSKKRIKI